MTVVAMMAIFFVVILAVGALALTIPAVYLYGAAGIECLIGATFYLVAANRVNRHGLLFVWIAVYGLIEGALGYSFLIPYFLVVAVLAELSMIGKDTYRNPVRNAIGWGIYAVGMFVGSVVPLLWSWESFSQMALKSGFTETTLNMQVEMVTSPQLMALGIAITAACAALGVLFGQRLLRRHFERSGIVS